MKYNTTFNNDKYVISFTDMERDVNVTWQTDYKKVCILYIIYVSFFILGRVNGVALFTKVIMRKMGF